MRRNLYLRLAVLPVLTIAALLFSQGAFAGTRPAAAITRTDPVIVNAPAMPALYSLPVGQLFVFAFKGGTWAQIPFQVDERDTTGKLVAIGDGFFNCGTNTLPPPSACGAGNAGDEVVFMAQDLGEQNGNGPMVNGTLVSPTWYQITVKDPVTPGAQGYAYIVQSSTLTPSFGAGYTSFDTANSRIIGKSYQLGWNAANKDNFFSYLTISDSTNILDRTPKIYACAGIISFCLTEDNSVVKGQGLALIKTGPVRVTVRGGGSALTNEVLGYGWTATATEKVNSPVKINSIRESTDWTAQVVPATLYNTVVPAGVTIDGLPDTVPPTPYSPWWQMSSSHGTVINTGNPTPAGGAPTNYYADNGAVPDPLDPKDPTQYGDVGALVTNPVAAFTYPFNLYFLTGKQANVGDTYNNYFKSPLTNTAQIQNEFLPPRVYIPYAAR